MRTETERITTARTGVTIIELMVVIGIVALLLGILLPALVGTKESAAEVRSLANLRSIGQTLAGFQAASNDEYPFYEAGDHLYSFPEVVGTEYAISFTPHWQFRSYWAAHPTIH